MHGQFQQQQMMQMQHASMLGGGPYSSMYGAQQAENIAGGALNTAAAIGSPLASLGASTLGTNMLMGGLVGGGSLAGGIMGAGAVAGGAMAAGYVGNQLFTGAQQQQRFNTSMRANYRFANAQGGQGFSRGGLGSIGDTMRQMSTQQGGMGEMIGFEELGRLATNMGRMGMAQGVRDAKDFTQKFKTMVSSLKEIATEMGTSLEEAQKMMGAARGSGIFGSRNAAQFAKDIRSGAVAGGLATSELTGMANIGSQISRSIGGLGRQGARGGIETLTNIGVAQQMGVLSEEDVYNATGLTGAEGRRALATQQMSSSARFLKGGLGRRFLASIAGKDGTLDAASVEEYMAGGVGTGRTTQMYQQNLRKVGRANFIRNEGRLRGAALEQFGGLAPAMVMKGWLEDRGMELGEDDDRANIFVQRRLGMGRDEADAMLKQVRALPQLLRQRRTAAEDDELSRGLSRRQASTGLAGVKRKFEKVRAEVNAGLQQVGADFYSEMSDSVEGAINKLTGNYLKEFHRSVGTDFRTAMRGGALGDATFRRTFGGADTVFGARGDVGRMAADLGLRKGMSAADDVASFQKQDAARFAKAGFTNMGGTAAELRKSLADVEDVSTAFATGGAELKGRAGVVGLGKDASQFIQESLQYGAVKGRGFERLSSMGQMLGDLAAKKGGKFLALKRRFDSAGREEKAQIMASLTQGAGVGEGEEAMFASPEMQSIFGGTKFGTVGEKHLAIGEALTGASADTSFLGKFKKGALKGAVAGSFLPGIGTGVGAVLGGLGQAIFGGDEVASGQLTDKQARAAGRFMESDTGARLGASALSMDEDIRAGAASRIRERMTELTRRGGEGLEGLSRDERGEFEALKGLSFAQKLGGLEGPERQAKLAELAKMTGMSEQDIESRAQRATVVVAERKGQNRREALERFGEQARQRRASMRRAGLLTRSNDGQLRVSSDVLAKFGGDESTMGRALQAMITQTTAMASGTEAGLTQAQEAGGELTSMLSGMSAEQKREFADKLRTTAGAGGLRSRVLYEAGLQRKIETGRRRRGEGGGLGAIAGALGSGLRAKDIKGMLGEGGGIGGVAAAIAQDIGLDAGGEGMKGLREALRAAQEGRGGQAASALATLQGSAEIQEAQRKKRVASQEAENPLDADRNRKLDKVVEATEKMARSITASNSHLEKIADSSAGKAEEGGGLFG